MVLGQYYLECERNFDSALLHLEKAQKLGEDSLSATDLVPVRVLLFKTLVLHANRASAARHCGHAREVLAALDQDLGNPPEGARDTFYPERPVVDYWRSKYVEVCK
jgi:hypothetical protein